MILGFGFIAYPAKYGVSGIMTFTVNQKGVIYEVDLGSKTTAIVNHEVEFDLGKKWRKVSKKYLAETGPAGFGN